MFSKVEDNQSGISVALNAGNPADFRAIYDECMQMLFKISYRIVNDEEAAEDLVHDSLIKANEKCLVFPSLNDAIMCGEAPFLAASSATVSGLQS